MEDGKTDEFSSPFNMYFSFSDTSPEMSEDDESGDVYEFRSVDKLRRHRRWSRIPVAVYRYLVLICCGMTGWGVYFTIMDRIAAVVRVNLS